MAPVVQDEMVIPLQAERVEVTRRDTITGRVRVETVTTTRDVAIDEMLTHEHAEIERVPVRRLIDLAPEVRQEGDTIIVPVIEEVVTTERRLFLKEEVRIRMVRTTERHQETVTLREQDAVITRLGATPDVDPTASLATANDPHAPSTAS